MNLKNITHSKNITKILFGLGAFIVVLFVFQAGIEIGYRKASFSYGFGDNYHRIFGEPERGFMMREGMMRGGFLETNGATGKIVKISLPTLVVSGLDNVEKVVLIKNDTEVRQFRNDIKASDLKVNDIVVVLGSPNTSSQIEAKLIRVMPTSTGFIMGGGRGSW